MPKYTNRQQLISTKTIHEIAKETYNDMTEKLIDRRYIFGRYDPLNNLWSPIPPSTQASRAIDWSGHVEEMTDIRKSDIATVANSYPADDADDQKNQTLEALAQGTNVLTSVLPMDGKRTGDTILVYAVSALVRIEVKHNQNVPGGDTTIVNDTVKFKYGFFTWRKITSQGYLDNTYEPDCRSLIRWKPFGYSHQLDNKEEGIGYNGNPFATNNLNMILNSEKVRVLSMGDCNIRVPNTENANNVQIKRIYKEFKTPIEINYKPNSLTGQEVLNQKIYFAIQTDVPNEHLTYSAPRVQVCTKLYYNSRL